jgi:hypothetical protein
VAHNRLALQTASREGYSIEARGGRRFLDFVVDDVSVYSLVRARQLDHMSPLQLAPALPRGEFRRQIEMLGGRRQGDAPGGRVAIYTCPECGDIACGAVTVELRLAETEVEWVDWRYENDYDSSMAYELEEFPRPCFNRIAYDQALEGALEAPFVT